MGERYRIDITHITRFVRSPAVKLKRVGEATAAYVAAQRAIHVLNPTAELLLRCLESPLTRSEMVTLLAELTDGSPEVIASDLGEVLPEFLRLQLVVRAA